MMQPDSPIFNQSTDIAENVTLYIDFDLLINVVFKDDQVKIKLNKHLIKLLTVFIEKIRRDQKVAPQPKVNIVILLKIEKCCAKGYQIFLKTKFTGYLNQFPIIADFKKKLSYLVSIDFKNHYISPMNYSKLGERTNGSTFLLSADEAVIKEIQPKNCTVISAAADYWISDDYLKLVQSCVAKQNLKIMLYSDIDRSLLDYNVSGILGETILVGPTLQLIRQLMHCGLDVTLKLITSRTGDQQFENSDHPNSTKSLKAKLLDHGIKVEDVIFVGAKCMKVDRIIQAVHFGHPYDCMFYFEDSDVQLEAAAQSGNKIAISGKQFLVIKVNQPDSFYPGALDEMLNAFKAAPADPIQDDSASCSTPQCRS